MDEKQKGDFMEFGNGKGNQLSGVKIPDLNRIGKVGKIAGVVAFVVILGFLIAPYVTVKTATDADSALLELTPDRNVLGEIAAARGFTGDSAKAFVESAFAGLAGENAPCYSPAVFLRTADDAALKEMFVAGYVAITPEGKAIFEEDGLDKKVLETKIKTLSLNRELVILN